MAVERERGISVSSAVMSFQLERLAFNLWTRRVAGISAHRNFSENTYRSG
jgi:peptide subunit release factor RF-3